MTRGSACESLYFKKDLAKERKDIFPQIIVDIGNLIWFYLEFQNLSKLEFQKPKKSLKYFVIRCRLCQKWKSKLIFWLCIVAAWWHSIKSRARFWRIFRASFTNPHTKKVSHYGVIFNGISDHNFIYCTRKIKTVKIGKHSTIAIRSYTKSSKESLLERLRKKDLPDYSTFNCIDAVYTDWLEGIVNEIARM